MTTSSSPRPTQTRTTRMTSLSSSSLFLVVPSFSPRRTTSWWGSKKRRQRRIIRMSSHLVQKRCWKNSDNEILARKIEDSEHLQKTVFLDSNGTLALGVARSAADDNLCLSCKIFRLFLPSSSNHETSTGSVLATTRISTTSTTTSVDAIQSLDSGKAFSVATTDGSIYIVDTEIGKPILLLPKPTHESNNNNNNHMFEEVHHPWNYLQNNHTTHFRKTWNVKPIPISDSTTTTTSTTSTTTTTSTQLLLHNDNHFSSSSSVFSVLQRIKDRSQVFLRILDTRLPNTTTTTTTTRLNLGAEEGTIVTGACFHSNVSAAVSTPNSILLFDIRAMRHNNNHKIISLQQKNSKSPGSLLNNNNYTYSSNTNLISIDRDKVALSSVVQQKYRCQVWDLSRSEPSHTIESPPDCNVVQSYTPFDSYAADPSLPVVFAYYTDTSHQLHLHSYQGNETKRITRNVPTDRWGIPGVLLHLSCNPRYDRMLYTLDWDSAYLGA